MKRTLLHAVTLVLFFFAPTAASAQTGKIAGTVTDAESGDPIPGVNVLVEGTERGTSTDGQGQYTIVNISPDTYTRLDALHRLRQLPADHPLEQPGWLRRHGHV